MEKNRRKGEMSCAKKKKKKIALTRNRTPDQLPESQLLSNTTPLTHISVRAPKCQIVRARNEPRGTEFVVYFKHWTVGWTVSYPIIRTISSVTEQWTATLQFPPDHICTLFDSSGEIFSQFIFSSQSLQRLCVFGTDFFFSILV